MKDQFNDKILSILFKKKKKENSKKAKKKTLFGILKAIVIFFWKNGKTQTRF